jgi:conjugative relaxase-like TrwC/TraI family protein
VLRVTTLYASSAMATAKYYTRYLIDAPGEVPGQWSGHQADLLGLAGTVTTDALERLLSGCDPSSGVTLGYPLVDRTVTNDKVVRAVAGFDATVSAPKSVSVLWALTGDAGLVECHDVAVQAVVNHLERYGSSTRIRSNGARLHPDSQGLIVAAFRQTTSRLDDPQLHTHVVISGKVQTVDGRWLALDARFVKKHQRSLGGLYQSVLRAELTHRYGVEFGEIVNGQAEIAGVPGELLELFSKRTAEVDRALTTKIAEFSAREGRDPSRWERAAMTREAAVDTRIHKSGNAVADLQTRWLNETFDAGITPEDLVASVTAAGQARTPAEQVTIGEVIEALSATGSAWHRADVMRTICDLQRPLPEINGQQWAAALEQATGRVIEHCVNLDPPHGDTTRLRRSDGRSVWIEPIAAHITSNEILAQEERILTWAIDAQTPDSQPSSTVLPRGLDVMQRDAAAAVAGNDRLVLIVGPAGTGKTTMLRAAVNDLDNQQRSVYGVSPTAQAARTLERETGMPCDTVAKLLHEWTRPDRPPEARWNLPTGCTLIIDEAGMLGTGNLDQLIELAEHKRWRIAAVGDPKQLQAVGRGGMFNELCSTGRTIQLKQVHRFQEPWEAHASLLLRNGDPRALDIYQAHHRIRAGTLDEHLDYFADEWLQHHDAGKTTAVMASTNDQVDLINTHIQNSRRQLGDIEVERQVGIGGGEHAGVGDVVATRRNDRKLTTATGEQVRNRDQWTVTSIHDNGDITLTPNSGRGQITLPTEYVTEHVRLGYAATEMGTQSDTVTASFELASRATTCRNLYVAMSRWERTNIVCVVTETHDLAEARDVLDAIIAFDRADVPATTQRHDLAKLDNQHAPRCEVPGWFPQLRTATALQLDQAITDHARRQDRQQELQQRVMAVEERRRQALAATKPFEQAIDAAEIRLAQAGAKKQSLDQRLRTAKRRDRRSIRAEISSADHELELAAADRADAVRQARPTATTRADTSRELNDLRQEQWREQLFARWTGGTDTIEILQHRLDSLDTWQRWATGANLDPNRIREMAECLRVTRDQTRRFSTLRTSLLTHPDTRAIDLAAHPASPAQRQPNMSIEIL